MRYLDRSARPARQTNLNFPFSVRMLFSRLDLPPGEPRRRKGPRGLELGGMVRGANPRGRYAYPQPVVALGPGRALRTDISLAAT